jgi:hypothetical protein
VRRSVGRATRHQLRLIARQALAAEIVNAMSAVRVQSSSAPLLTGGLAPLRLRAAWRSCGKQPRRVCMEDGCRSLM